MISGATTSIVYDTIQVDNLIDGLEDRVDEITTVLNGISTPLDETFKALQTAATLTAPAGEYVFGIEQDVQGVVAITTTALPTASTTDLGMVQIVAAQTPVVGDYVVYSKDAVDEIVLDIQGGGSGLDSRYKKIQTAVTNPVASGNAITFISSIEQDAQGVITATAATVPAASTTGLGLVQYAIGVTTASPRVYDTNEVDRLIAEAEAAAFVAAVTTTTPVTGDAHTIYFVANGSGTTPNYYTEYMYVNGAWEVVGNTELAIETLETTEIENIFNAAFSD